MSETRFCEHCGQILQPGDGVYLCRGCIDAAEHRPADTGKDAGAWVIACAAAAVFLAIGLAMMAYGAWSMLGAD